MATLGSTHNSSLWRCDVYVYHSQTRAATRNGQKSFGLSVGQQTSERGVAHCTNWKPRTQTERRIYLYAAEGGVRYGPGRINPAFRVRGDRHGSGFTKVP